MENSKSRRSAAVWVLPLDSGGCGGCIQQIHALLGPQYAAQMRAQGISLARSPHHADIVLITGALTEVAREPLQRVLAGVPQPRALVAAGNCAIDGCVFRGSPCLIANGAEWLDVNVEIAGCPPTPQAILDAISEAAQLLSSEPDDDELADMEGDAEQTDDDGDEGDVVEGERGPVADAPSDEPRASQSAANGRGGTR